MHLLAVLPDALGVHKRRGSSMRGTLTPRIVPVRFGDASTIFSDASSFSSPKNILDNYYSVFSRRQYDLVQPDIWYQMTWPEHRCSITSRALTRVLASLVRHNGRWREGSSASSPPGQESWSIVFWRVTAETSPTAAIPVYPRGVSGRLRVRLAVAVSGRIRSRYGHGQSGSSFRLGDHERDARTNTFRRLIIRSGA